jgi:hypothetical protein
VQQFGITYHKSNTPLKRPWKYHSIKQSPVQ